MGALDERDAAILAEIAQGEVLPRAERETILRDADVTPRGRRIGRVLIGSIKGSRNDRLIADSFRKWARRNGVFVQRQRKAKRAAAG